MSVDLSNGEGESEGTRYNHMVTKLNELSNIQKQDGDESKSNDTAEGKGNVQDDEANLSDSSTSDSDTDDEESDEEPIRAPIELLSEFLQYVRTAHWEDAAKLCKMILIYEPDNQEALRFGPLIEDKIQVEKELDEEESDESSDEETSDESEEEDGDEENDEESEDSSENEEERTHHLPNRLVFPYEQRVWKP